MKKGLFYLCFAFIMIFALCSCGETPATSNTNVESSKRLDEGSKSSVTNPTNSGNPSESSSLPVKKTYSITFNDDEGNLIEVKKVEEGEVPTLVATKTATKEWTYTFAGWSETLGGTTLTKLPAATKDATYYAVFSSSKQEYTVTFHENGGTSVKAITKKYGEKINEAPSTTKDGNRFVCWCLDEKLTEKAEFPLTILNNVELYAKWNESVDIKKYLETLTNGYSINPYTLIPESMRPGYVHNLISGDPNIDYSNFVDKNQLISEGYGEQWNMIVSNLNQSMTFFKVLNGAEGVVTSGVAAFNNYFDSNPEATANYSFKYGDYNVTINFENNIIYYILDFQVKGIDAQIALYMNVNESVKHVRIQIGNPNALTYEVTDSSYKFAIKYAGVRRAMFEIKKNKDNTVEGHINEILTAAGKELKSAADFYITDSYVSAIGNKASGIIGFTGYISELYNAKTGKMLGYEVQETLKGITFNTLWFDLKYVDGLNNIKYQEKTDDTEEAFFVNNSTTAFESKLVGGIGTKMASRRYDIEFRSQFFYKYDAEKDSYIEVEIKVPMLFVQAEYYDNLNSDVSSKNKGLSISIILGSTYLNKIEADYEKYIPMFIDNKANISSDEIIAYIGEAFKFNQQ